MSEPTAPPGVPTKHWEAFREDCAEIVMAALVLTNCDHILSPLSRDDLIQLTAHTAVQSALPLWMALAEDSCEPGYEAYRRTLAIRCLAMIASKQPGLHSAAGETRMLLLHQIARTAVKAADAVIEKLREGV